MAPRSFAGKALKTVNLLTSLPIRRKPSRLLPLKHFETFAIDLQTAAHFCHGLNLFHRTERPAQTDEGPALASGLLLIKTVMDDTWSAYLSSLILSLALVGSISGIAAELEYISPARETALSEQFAQAVGLSEKELARMAQTKAWSCDMYGVRTRMQVERNVSLYIWDRPKAATSALAGGILVNSGAHPVTEYKVDHGTLTGKTDRLVDEVRFTRSGQLISRLSALSPAKGVLAYSVCTAL